MSSTAPAWLERVESEKSPKLLAPLERNRMNESSRIKIGPVRTKFADTARAILGRRQFYDRQQKTKAIGSTVRV
jgi:hypothetical protein